MSQHPIQRRLVRTAAGFTRKAKHYGDPNRLNAEDLAHIYLRDEGNCFYCGTGVNPRTSTFDHKTPFHRGGRNTADNVVVCCTIDQRAKFTQTAEEYIEWLALTRHCASCGKAFKPRAADYRRGYGRYCSRVCSGRAGGEAERS